MAKAPKNTGRAGADDKSAAPRTTAPATESEGSAATAGAADTASAAPAADTTAGSDAGDRIAGDTVNAAQSSDGRIHQSFGGAASRFDDVMAAMDGLLWQLQELAASNVPLDPAEREALVIQSAELQTVLRKHFAAAHDQAGHDDDAADGPTKGQAAAAVGVTEDQVLDFAWNGTALTVVTTAGQKLRWKP